MITVHMDVCLLAISLILEYGDMFQLDHILTKYTGIHGDIFFTKIKLLVGAKDAYLCPLLFLLK